MTKTNKLQGIKQLKVMRALDNLDTTSSESNLSVLAFDYPPTYAADFMREVLAQFQLQFASDKKASRTGKEFLANRAS